MLIERNGGLITLCHSCEFACHQRVLKTFPGPGYLHSEDGVFWQWHPLEYLYVWLTISSCYGSMPLDLELIVRDGGLRNLCHSWVFACQQRVLKTSIGPIYLQSEDGVVWLWHPFGNLYRWLTISSCYGSILLALGLMGRMVVWALYLMFAGLLVSRWWYKRFLFDGLSTLTMG